MGMVGLIATAALSWYALNVVLVCWSCFDSILVLGWFAPAV